MKKPFKVGDLVTSIFQNKPGIIRRVTACEKDSSCHSGEITVDEFLKGRG